MNINPPNWDVNSNSKIKVIKEIESIYNKYVKILPSIKFINYHSYLKDKEEKENSIEFKPKQNITVNKIGGEYRMIKGKII